ncbi:4F2 cell-surface antigen heavy chain-like isoform X2 [Paroedura picta]|uniref:4F2 cell-surface antigen heavy chain-like isoform X2 n=1 Tax=Paroedura picta TaxID=143630 RepID=UPI004055D072
MPPTGTPLPPAPSSLFSGGGTAEPPPPHSTPFSLSQARIISSAKQELYRKKSSWARTFKMGKAEAPVANRVPSERLPLLSQPSSSGAYLSQEEVVQQARGPPWKGLRIALLCLVAALFVCMLATALALLLMMPQPGLPLSWWQKATFYHLPSASFPDSNGDGHGDLEGVSHLLGRLVELPAQALVLGSVLEGSGTNLTRVRSVHGSLEQLWLLLAEGHRHGIRILLELPTWAEEPDLVPEDNRTGSHLKRALQFWHAQGVDGFLVNKDPPWRLNAVLNAWGELERQSRMDPAEERVLMVWDKSGTCSLSCRVTSRVILTCHLPASEKDLTAGALTQRLEVALEHPGGPWPGWTGGSRGGWLPCPRGSSLCSPRWLGGSGRVQKWRRHLGFCCSAFLGHPSCKEGWDPPFHWTTAGSRAPTGTPLPPSTAPFCLSTQVPLLCRVLPSPLCPSPTTPVMFLLSSARASALAFWRSSTWTLSPAAST